MTAVPRPRCPMGPLLEGVETDPGEGEVDHIAVLRRADGGVDRDLPGGAPGVAHVEIRADDGLGGARHVVQDAADPDAEVFSLEGGAGDRDEENSVISIDIHGTVSPGVAGHDRAAGNLGRSVGIGVEIEKVPFAPYLPPAPRPDELKPPDVPMLTCTTSWSAVTLKPPLPKLSWVPGPPTMASVVLFMTRRSAKPRRPPPRRRWHQEPCPRRLPIPHSRSD